MAKPYGCADNQTRLSLFLSVEQIRTVLRAIAAALDNPDVTEDNSVFRITLKSDVNSEESGGKVEYEIAFDDPIIKIAEGFADTSS